MNKPKIDWILLTIITIMMSVLVFLIYIVSN